MNDDTQNTGDATTPDADPNDAAVSAVLDLVYEGNLSEMQLARLQVAVRPARLPPLDEVKSFVSDMRVGGDVSYRRIRAMFELVIIEREDKHARRQGLRS